MGTITISTAGFTSPRPNGSRTGNMSDADYDRFIAWARAKTVTTVPDVRTAGQVLADFVLAEWQAWKNAVQAHERLPPTESTPINITE